MELHTRVELIETLLQEAEQKTTALHHTLAAQARAKEEIPQAGHDTPLLQEGATLKYEQDLWATGADKPDRGPYALGRY